MVKSDTCTQLPTSDRVLRDFALRVTTEHLRTLRAEEEVAPAALPKVLIADPSGNNSWIACVEIVWNYNTLEYWH